LGRRQLRLGFGERLEGHGDQEGADADAEGADEQPAVAGVGVVDQAACHGTGGHAQAAGHGGAADDGSHQPQRKILTRQYGIERHHAGIDKAEQRRHGVKRAKIAHEEIGERPEGLEQQPAHQHVLGAELVSKDAEGHTAAHARQAFHAVDRNCGDQRNAAADGVAHRMEDRAGVRGAAEEIREHQDDELRRADDLLQGHGGLRFIIGNCCIPGCESRRRAHQQCCRNHHGSHKHGDDLQRGPPVINGDEPCRDRRHGKGRHAHAGRYQRNRKAAVRVEPARHAGHQRCKNGSDRSADGQAEDELEGEKRCRLARQKQTRSQDH